MTQQQYIMARDLYLQGKSLRQIGKELNINRKKLSIKLKEDNISTSRFISENTINKAIKMFTNKSTTSIAKELNIDRQVLTRELRKRGYITKKMKSNMGIRKYDYDDDFAMSLIKDYESLSMKLLSDKYNISTSVVKNILKHHNINTDKQFKGYFCNQTIFDEINTEHKAYWLGFLYADGNVRIGDKHVIELGLKKSDRHHIEKFKSFIESEAPIKDRSIILNDKIYESSRISIGNKYLAYSLIKKGCIPNKSLILKFPIEIPKSLIHHFMRGYFDGDGSIIISNNQLRFSIIGTEQFLDKYVEQLKLHKNKYYSNGRAFSTGYSGNKLCRYIYNYLYKNATIYLERKQSKFTAVLG